jgi:hypothetical protein
MQTPVRRKVAALGENKTAQLFGGFVFMARVLSVKERPLRVAAIFWGTRRAILRNDQHRLLPLHGGRDLRPRLLAGQRRSRCITHKAPSPSIFIRFRPRPLKESGDSP